MSYFLNIISKITTKHQILIWKDFIYVLKIREMWYEGKMLAIFIR